MDEQQSRAWLAHQLDMEAFPQKLWELIPADLVSAARNDPVDREEFLLPRAQGLLLAAQLGKNGLDLERIDLAEDIKDGDERLEEEHGEYERERAAGYAEYRAKLAADDPRVLGFRREYLGGEDREFTSEVAQRFLADGVHLASLGSVSRRLSKTYPWTEEQIAWFVLTGQAPESAPISGSIKRRSGKSYTYGGSTLAARAGDQPQTSWVRLGET